MTEGLARGYYDNVRADILPLLDVGAERILEIGCGSGATLAYLKEQGLCQWVGGVEPVAAAARIARQRTDFFLEGHIETLSLALPPGSIDVILCLDVLEHLVDPWSVLQKLYPFLKPGGALIASIPNIRFYKILVDLVFRGKFEYADAGILDRTHLRFFTRASAVSLIESCGLRIETIRGTGLESGKGRTRANRLTFGLLEDIYVLQYLLRGRKPEPSRMASCA